MKVCIDATPLDNEHRFRGIGSYVSGLINGLCECSTNIVITQMRLSNKISRAACSHTDIVFIQRPVWPSVRFQWLVNELMLPFDINRANARIFHATDPRAISVGRGYATIATAYDLIPLIFADEYIDDSSLDERLAYKISYKNYKRVDRIIAISESTKTDFIKYLDIDPNKISVVMPGYDSDLFKPVKNPDLSGYNLPDKFFLYVGAYDTRKNVRKILEGYARICKDVEENFVFTGTISKEQRKRFEEDIDRLGLSRRVIFLGYMPTEVLPCLYSKATAFVFISLYEGFGLPVLEAAACGCPVITSNTSSLPEAAGSAAVLIDPNDYRELAKWLAILSNDRETRFLLQERSVKHAAGFSWKKSAEETIKIYREVLS
ncbi:MAG: glycosyltransferase family 1 protein [bacterium]